MQARMISGLFTVLAMVVVATAVTLVVTAPNGLRGPARAPGGAEERLEQKLTTELRLDALREAKAAGTFGRRERVVLAAAPGWAGEQLMNVPTDDWEPAIAADPAAPFVYLVTTRYAPKPCPGNCPSPWMALEISSDGGATWSPGVPLCACKGSAQYDPIIEVVPNTGHVYALYMNGFNTVFIKSTNHGQTWSTPVPTYGQVSWTDKPVLAMSNDGQHVYVSWNGPNAGDPYVAQSHDAGATWTQTKLVNGPRYFFAYDADVLPNGTVVFSESSIDLRRPGVVAGRPGPTSRVRLDEPGSLLAERRRGHRRDRRGVRRRRVLIGLLHRPQRCVRRRVREPRDGLRRRDDAGRQAADLLEAIDERRTHVVGPHHLVAGERAVHRSRRRVPRRR